MKKQKIKIAVILTVLTIMSINSTYGVKPGDRPHELSVYGSGGLSSFRYKLSTSDVRNGIGSNFGVGYTYFFDSKIGAHIGAGLGMYSKKVNVNDFKVVSSDLIDNEGDRFNMHSTLFGYDETQKAMFLNIPVMAIYEQYIGKRPVYAMGGFKTGIPLKGKYAATSTRLENASYYPEYDNWATTQKFAGNGVFDGKEFDGDLKLGVSVMLALEAGTKFNLYKDFSLYVGAFFDYGLNSVLKDKHRKFINYSALDPSAFNANLFSVPDKTNVIAAGVVLRVNFSIDNSTNPRKGRSVDKRINPFGVLER